jgi:acetylornithine deacetylase/succinyl-diaminopimelate desuccinylase-like protein
MSEDLRNRISALMPRAKSDLAELVAFRSVADPHVEPPEECEKAAQWVVDAFKDAGVADVAAHETSDGSKVVLGDIPAPEGAPTVLLYSHYDVQPGLDPALWTSPPWELTERDGRWYGRGTADCKGNTIVTLLALRALGVDEGAQLPVGVKIVVEGSEEQGTGGLDSFVEENPELFRSDAIAILDSGNFSLGLPTLTTSLRGIANVIVRVKTLEGAQHSGVYGGAAPDALGALIKMLAGLTDDAGNTTIEGLDASQSWDGVEYPPEQFAKDAGRDDLAAPDGDGPGDRRARRQRRVQLNLPVGRRKGQRSRPAGDHRRAGSRSVDRAAQAVRTLERASRDRARSRRRPILRRHRRPSI